MRNNVMIGATITQHAKLIIYVEAKIKYAEDIDKLKNN